MRIFFIFFSVLLVTVSPAFSQARDGILVTKKGDTLRGRISYDPTSKSSDLLFRGPDVPQGGKPTKYPPGVLVSYQFEGKEVWLAQAVKRGDVWDSTFLVTVLKGNVTLYKSLIMSDKRFYTQKGNGPIEELMDELITKRVDGNLISYNSEKFKAQLKLLFADCPSMEKSLVKAAMQETRLIKLIEEYNACVDLSIADK